MITHWVLLCVYYYVSSANIKPVRVFPLRYNYTPSTIATPRLFPSPQIKLTQKDESYPIAPPTHLLFMKKKKNSELVLYSEYIIILCHKLYNIFKTITNYTHH